MCGQYQFIYLHAALYTLLTIPVELLLRPFCSSFPVTFYALVTSYGH